jgi:outer membrane murein-binding lipoprotein Lpp
MRTSKRALAIITMVISILMLVLSLAGIIGTWIVRAELATRLVNVATVAEIRVSLIKGGLDRLDTAISQANALVRGVEQDVQAFGTDLEHNRPLLTAISDKVGLELEPLFDSVREIATTIGETVDAANTAIEAINAIPFVSIPAPVLEKANKLSQDVETLGTQIRDLRASIDAKRSEIIRGTVASITTPAAQIGSALGELQDTVSSYSQEVGAIQERLASFKESIGGRLTWIAGILTVILLWVALSQAAVLVLGWRFYSGKDLLAPGPASTPADADAVPAS